jgi:hypothetical protein
MSVEQIFGCFLSWWINCSSFIDVKRSNFNQDHLKVRKTLKAFILTFSELGKLFGCLLDKMIDKRVLSGIQSMTYGKKYIVLPLDCHWNSLVSCTIERITCKWKCEHVSSIDFKLCFPMQKYLHLRIVYYQQIKTESKRGKINLPTWLSKSQTSLGF